MENKIKLQEVISSDYAETPEQGDSVYKELLPEIKEHIAKKEKFYIDFADIKNVTTAFLNNFVGKLFFELDYEDLQKTMSFCGFSSKVQINILRHCIANAISLSRLNKK